MTLSGQVIDFARLDFRDYFDETTGIGHVAIVQMQFSTFVGIPIFVQMFDPFGIERTSSTDNAVHFVTFAQKEFG